MNSSRNVLKSVEALIEKGEPTVPSTIAEEKATNPFLRVAEPSIRSVLNMEAATDEEVFAVLRQRKDSF